jgi:isochorismate synthase
VSPPKSLARITRLGPSYDLLAAYHPTGVFMEREGIGVAGGVSSGFAMAITGTQAGLRAAGPAAGPDDLFGWLETIEADADAPPPFVFGSVPFDPNRFGWFQIPRSAVRRDREGETWAIDIDRPDHAMPVTSERFVGRAAPHEPFRGMQIRPEPLPDAYERAVAVAVERIRAGELRKVVLARTMELVAGRELDPRQLLWRLRAAEPHGYSFAVPIDSGAAVMVGASPELLVSRFGREVRANPLAGSAPRFGDAAKDTASAERLQASAKDGEEHRIVVEAIATALGPVCESLTWDPEPVLLETANVWHLSTRFSGTLKEPTPHALELVRLLHPTPAVCGDPRDAAMALIRSLEPVPRGAYAGAVGWMDANGDGTWAIALRCARLKGDVARLYAGAGIVADSDPASELDETERKFRAFLDSLRWG